MPSVNSFFSGDTIRFQVTFTVGSTNTDPSTSVTFRIKNPNGVVTSYIYGTDADLITSATGIYYINLALTLTGEYNFRWEGAGSTAPGVSEGRIRINKSNVIM